MLLNVLKRFSFLIWNNLKISQFFWTICKREHEILFKIDINRYESIKKGGYLVDSIYKELKKFNNEKITKNINMKVNIKVKVKD